MARWDGFLAQPLGRKQAQHLTAARKFESSRGQERSGGLRSSDVGRGGAGGARAQRAVRTTKWTKEGGARLVPSVLSWRLLRQGWELCGGDVCPPAQQVEVRKSTRGQPRRSSTATATATPAAASLGPRPSAPSRLQGSCSGRVSLSRANCPAASVKRRASPARP